VIHVMIDLSHCIVLGSVTKVHGIRGQLVLRLDSVSFDDILKMETVFIEIDGLPVPFFVDEYTMKNSDTVILTVEDISSETKAREFIGCRIFVNADTVQQKVKDITQSDVLLGYEVFDKLHGRIGILEEIQHIQQNPLFRIMEGKREFLIPMQAEFILKIDKSKKQILLNTPAGLLDLF
jgi:16S rRNA processing protein RimM